MEIVIGNGLLEVVRQSFERGWVKVTDDNKEKVDEVIHQYIGEQSSYGRCSADWRKARKEIEADTTMRNELIERLRTLS